MFTQKLREPQGYHRLADIMGRYPDIAIFRRFGCLNMMNLLCLQAELIELQIACEGVWQADDNSDEKDKKMFSTNFHELFMKKESSQYKLLLELREKLREYNEAVLQASRICQMSSPDSGDIDCLRKWLHERKFPEGFEWLTWNPQENQSKFFDDKELLTLQPTLNEQDAFSKALSSSLLSLWNFLRTFRWSSTSSKDARLEKTIDSDDGIMHYSQEGLLKFNNMLISVIGAAMPIASIVALYFIKTEGGRIGAMAGFTILFAFVLATCTNARRLEIAASTAAFAAVEVVFIGSNLGNP
ncbi:hypothetical protein KCU71_g11189, partial [Aureobasidium melanogenum]